MKRDLDLIRSILLAMEASPTGYAPEELHVPGFTDDQIGYHVYLMGQAGFIEASEVTSRDSSSPQAIPICLRWEGYEFLDAARDDTRWRQARTAIREKAGTVTVAVLTQVLVSMAKSAMGLQ